VFCPRYVVRAGDELLVLRHTTMKTMVRALLRDAGFPSRFAWFQRLS
jgi:hypothetical protein